MAGDPPRVRRRVRVRGEVQGVGFRPFVFHQAARLDLTGWVRNDGAGVELEVEGAAAAVSTFVAELLTAAPPLARVRAVEEHELVPLGVEREDGFVIQASRGGPVRTGITADAAICPDCLAELCDPDDRRYRYPFLNCTHCGPRFTITRSLPYDRSTTSMAGFPMCERCRAEYDDPHDRRFHAQPTACPACGPRLAGGDASDAGGDVIAHAVARLAAGEIVAIKGLGGFHLACDAGDPAAVARLRERKHREEKPLAIMVANPASLAEVAEVGEAEAALLGGVERPIVLLRKKPWCDRALPGVAPGIAWLGAMLPYTPLHYLLFHEAAGRPPGTGWLDRAQPLRLVMTSANPGGEPLVTGNREAATRLAGIADLIVEHDRAIVARCDDSVVRARGARVGLVRRARGFTPRAIPLSGGGPAVLALGGHFKNTVCVTRGAEAFLSPHLGDLHDPATRRALVHTTDHLLAVLDVTPERLACDLHPDFFSTDHAAGLAAARGLRLVRVQHHHAHIAAVVAEHRVTGPVLGLALDGVGYGADGGVWGGELLRVDGASWERLGHLRTLPLPGGDRAAREPWRMAAAALSLLGRADEIAWRFPNRPGAALIELLSGGEHAPPTSSAGRWFDAAAGLLGIREVMAFEGQAAMLLEGAAERHGAAPAWPDGWRATDPAELDLLPLLARLADVDPGDAAAVAAVAAGFHATLAEALAEWVIDHAARCGLLRVALGGGCFLNHILTERLVERLTGAGLEVLCAAEVPPGDGAISLGQAAVARS